MIFNCDLIFRFLVFCVLYSLLHKLVRYVDKLEKCFFFFFSLSSSTTNYIFVKKIKYLITPELLHFTLVALRKSIDMHSVGRSVDLSPAWNFTVKIHSFRTGKGNSKTFILRIFWLHSLEMQIRTSSSTELTR